MVSPYLLVAWHVQINWFARKYIPIWHDRDFGSVWNDCHCARHSFWSICLFETFCCCNWKVRLTALNLKFRDSESTITVKWQTQQVVEMSTDLNYLGGTLAKTAQCWRSKHKNVSLQACDTAIPHIYMRDTGSWPTPSKKKSLPYPFHTTCLRKHLNIKWQDRTQDTEVLERAPMSSEDGTFMTDWPCHQNAWYIITHKLNTCIFYEQIQMGLRYG